MRDIGEMFADQVDNTAEWRRNKAEQFPEDFRNSRAAEALERLSKKLPELEGSPLHQRAAELDERAAAHTSV